MKRKTTLVQLRLKSDDLALISRAAKGRNQTVGQFIIEQSNAAAERCLADQPNIQLSARRWQAFNKALNSPARQLPALRKLLTEPSIFEKNKINND